MSEYGRLCCFEDKFEVVSGEGIFMLASNCKLITYQLLDYSIILPLASMNLMLLDVFKNARRMKMNRIDITAKGNKKIGFA